jgi:hypothetical protein
MITVNGPRLPHPRTSGEGYWSANLRRCFIDRRATTGAAWSRAQQGRAYRRAVYRVQLNGTTVRIAFAISNWIDVNVAQPFASLGPVGQFFGGVVSGSGHVLAGLDWFEAYNFRYNDSDPLASARRYRLAIFVAGQNYLGAFAGRHPLSWSVVTCAPPPGGPFVRREYCERHCVCVASNRACFIPRRAYRHPEAQLPSVTTGEEFDLMGMAATASM